MHGRGGGVDGHSLASADPGCELSLKLPDAAAGGEPAAAQAVGHSVDFGLINIRLRKGEKSQSQDSFSGLSKKEQYKKY